MEPETGTIHKLHTVEGIDKASADGTGTWDWRGKGLLKVASSHWEILGWGEQDGTGVKWAVTMFAKTLFTPAGIVVYVSDASGLEAKMLEGVKVGLANIDGGDVNKLAGQVFEIQVDEARKDRCGKGRRSVCSMCGRALCILSP